MNTVAACLPEGDAIPKLRLKSCDGKVFEISHMAAGLSQVLTDTAANDEDGPEIPLPAMKERTLARLVQLSEHRCQHGFWNVNSLGTNEEEVESLLWAADFLMLDRLLFHCLARVGTLAAEKKPSNAFSARTLCRVLQHNQRLHLQAADLEALLEAVGLTAERGDNSASTAVLLHFGNASHKVRCAAAVAAGRISLRGQRPVTEALLGHLTSDGIPSVIAAAAAAFRQVGEVGDRRATKALLGRVGDARPDVRVAVAKGLGEVAEKGDEQTINVLLRGIGDRDSAVRQEVAKALGQVTDEGNQRVIATLLGCIRDGNLYARMEVVKALGQVAAKGNQQVIEALLGCVASDGAPNVIAAAAAAFKQVGESYLLATEVLLGRLTEPSCFVRQGAAMGIGAVAEKGNHRVIEALLIRMSDEDIAVREEAAKALGQVADEGNRQVIEALRNIDMRDDAFGEVRRARDEAIRILSPA